MLVHVVLAGLYKVLFGFKITAHMMAYSRAHIVFIIPDPDSNLLYRRRKLHQNAALVVMRMNMIMV